TGVLGRAISLREYPLVWYRTLFTALILLLFLLIFKKISKISKKELGRFFL
ncbi:MAG: hypothetical protein UZ11_BCD004001116, partial [Bacteroidetes bacterium OLB11]